jgi:xanthine dehydrogenase accessory factor
MTPRKVGARMLCAEDGETCGSVGGGALEQAALAAARELFTADVSERVLRWQLTQELGMCCGGEMVVRVEILEPPPLLFVFGAGYIGRALALLALGCGFRVVAVDERPDWADASRMPGVRVVCRDPEEFVRATLPGPRDFAVIVTHDHALDQRLVERMLPRPPRFLGLVGSLAKQRKFVARLEAKGFAAAAVARVRSPLGLAIGAATPEEIAVSVMAEVIAERRGVDVGPAGAPPRRHEGSRRAPRAGAAAPATQETETP